MKDHYILNSKQNIIRQAIMDLALEDDRSTLTGLLDWEVSKGRSIERLARFAERRLGISYRDACNAICILLPERLH